MPLMDHLVELRNRLGWSAAAFLIAFGICYYFAEPIFEFLVQPLADILTQQPGNRRMIFTALHEAFFTYIKVAFFAAAFVSFPVVSAQLWMFVAPGLYRHEKRAFLPFLVATPILFFMGGALVYYFVFPLAWKFFLSFEMAGGGDHLPIQLEAKVNEYLSLVMHLIFAFGISFELPVLLDSDGAGRHGDVQGPGGEAALCDRAGLHRGRGADAARRDQPGRARYPAAAALRNLDLVGTHRRAPESQARGGRGNDIRRRRGEAPSDHRQHISLTSSGR